MKYLFEKSKDSIACLGEAFSDKLSSGFYFLRDCINGLPVFVSVEKSVHFDTEYDEKHYFVIPFKLSEAGFALHTMRCLPEAALELNDLPKRRVFHFPNTYYESALRQKMLESARDLTINNQNRSSLERLADDIDALDTKLTYGMLVVGGVTAFFNPLIGGTIVAKAISPSLSRLMNKFGLRPLGAKISQHQLQKEIKSAEENVARQFSEANTLKVINPILQELEFALRTSETEHDPLIDPNLATGSIPELNNQRWRELTETAIYHLYKDVYDDSDKHKAASLGPEDLRWLKTLFEGRK